jgi:hypothetical protein
LALQEGPLSGQVRRDAAACAIHVEPTTEGNSLMRLIARQKYTYLLLALCLCLAMPALAQRDMGTILGTVTTLRGRSFPALA